jgi:hypothetical protein
MAARGSSLRAEGNLTLRTVCASCGKSIPTEVGHPHPLDESLRRETYALVGYLGGLRSIYAACSACHDSGWRPPRFAPVP